MSFTNLYYKRTTATPKACFVCYKPTTTVLATANTTDFIYTCDGHLSDPGFVTLVGESGDGVGAGGAKKMGLSAEEIAKVKAEWEESQRRKKEKEKAQKEMEDKDKEDKKDEGKGKESERKDSKSPTPVTPGAFPSPPGSSSSTGASTPTHQRYSLHRDFFAMRLGEHRKRRQAKQMQELAPRLPGAPRGSIL